jgi:cytochrome c551/c552
MKNIKFILFAILLLNNPLFGQDDPYAPAVDKDKLRVPKEDEYYNIVTMSVPDDILLEVGGLTTLPDGRVAMSTRRGDVWMVENPYGAGGRTPKYTLFASGLHEALGLVYKDDALYVAQRGELTKLVDENGDGKADVYETVYAWQLSGHYHEYSFGPALAPDGSFFVTANVAFGDEEWWRGESRVPMRGWTMHILPDGTMEPWATGMRSPCGFGMVGDDFFYSDNQGDWLGSGGIWHVTKGSFTGHPGGLKWADKIANSPVKLTTEQLYAKVSPRQVRNANGFYIKPENDETLPPQYFYELKKDFPAIKVPAVWLPHGILGISNSEIMVDKTGGKFGPFEGQIFVGDQGQSKISRVFLEKVNGEYQGASFDFRNNFQSGVLRMTWGHDGSLFVGETNRGWGSAGDKNEGFQRLIWNGKTPFEMKAVRAMPDGFEIEFTKPVDRISAENIGSYKARTFLYKYHPVYGSPPTDSKEMGVKGVLVSNDGLKVRVVVDDLRQYYIHELKLEGVLDADKKQALVHNIAYYTLNNIPTGEKMAVAAVSNNPPTITTPSVSTTKSDVKKPSTTASTTVRPTVEKPKPVAEKPKPVAKPTTVAKAPTFEEIKPILQKHTCMACHAADKKMIGPAYNEVAKRGYSNDKIVQLIWKPEPKNWPGYPTEMAPMPQVPKAEALKIAAWINSLKP